MKTRRPSPRVLHILPIMPIRTDRQLAADALHRSFIVKLQIWRGESSISPRKQRGMIPETRIPPALPTLVQLRHHQPLPLMITTHSSGCSIVPDAFN